jgi:enamine deaminase RidA (YjgF/YER057c/UK114 family)
VTEQAEAAYRALAAALGDEQASLRHVVAETIFLRDARRDLPLVLETRARVLGAIGQAAGAPLPGAIQQAPLGGQAALEIAASAVVARDRAAWSVRDVRHTPSCACAGCARSGGRLVRLSGETSLHTANVYGVGRDAYEQAWDMFRAAERLLETCGLGFRDVVRTWIHLRDIDRDYDALNAARREFFAARGIDQRPASTGVQGVPFPDEHLCTIRLQALKSPRATDVTGMSTPLLNEAWSYGADFARGLRVAEANKTSLHVSGTASIDQAGLTAHVGDFEAQAERMLDNIESLLAGQGARFTDLISGIAYLRHPSDALALRALFERRGFVGFPCALVQAPLCRPELLCETEVVALLPPAAPEA